MESKQIADFLTNILNEKTSILIDEPMSKHTTFKIGGNADIFIKITQIEDLKKVLQFAKENDIQVTVIGNGSNLLVKDNGVRGIVIQIAFNNIDIVENNEDEVLISVQSGVKLIELAYYFLKNNIEGFEFASGIPGTIGGAVKMNAGAYGTEFKDVIKTITFIDENMNIKKINCDEAKFDYRSSRFMNSSDIILEAELKLKKGKKEEIESKMQEYKAKRIETQPLDFPNAGSTFKRGSDFITAKLIDDLGLKGYRIGGAEVSLKHAGFIVNKGNATAKDVLDLVDFIKKKIFEEYGKNIELEVQVIGE